jgi:hypothetical protein
MKTYVVWLRNNTDSRDDEPIKIKAKDKDEATEIAGHHLNNRFTISRVYTLKEFKRWDPGWHSLIWGNKVINER